MRVTNLMLVSRSVDSLTRGLDDMARLERMISTGSKLQTLSDAPLDGRAVLEIDASARSIEQYRRNIGAATSKLAAEDATLDALGGILTRAREIAIQQGGGLANTATRTAAALEVRALRDAVVQLANERMNEAYLFGGAYADAPPLDATGALDPAQPARGSYPVEVGVGLVAPVTHDAGEIFIDTDVMGSLDTLEIALVGGSASEIQVAADRLRVAVGQVQDLVAEVGARQVRMDLALETLASNEEGLGTRRSTLVDVDLAEAVTRLSARRAAYEASLLVTARMLESTLVNYLR